MNTKYEAMIRLVCWGEELNPPALADLIGLDRSFCTMELKGEKVINKSSERIAKTGMLVYAYNNQFPDKKYNPDEQIKFFTGLLSRTVYKSKEFRKVDKAEFQIFIYYSESISGVSEFTLPIELISALSTNGISISITVLP